jgi:hypothetical protein
LNVVFLAEAEFELRVVGGLGEGGLISSKVGSSCALGEVFGDAESTTDSGPVDTELRYVSRLGNESIEEGWKDVLWEVENSEVVGVVGTYIEVDHVSACCIGCCCWCW